MIKNCLKSLVLAFVAVLLFGGVAMAAWEYMFPITIADTSNTIRTYYPILLGFGGQTLVDAGKIAANGTDTNVQIGSSTLKYMMSTTNVTAVLPSLPSGGLATVNFYTGYSPEQSVFSIVTGSGGYVTVSDNASMENGDNFSYEISGYFNTENGSGKGIFNKSGAISCNVSSTVSENITAIMIYQSAETLAPNGVGSATSCELFGAPTNWQACLTNDGHTSYVFNGGLVGGGWRGDLYATQDSSVGAGTIVNVTVGMLVSKNPGFDAGSAKTYLRTNGVNYEGNLVTVPDGYGGYTTTYTTNPQSGNPWSWGEVNNMEIGVTLWGTDGPPIQDARCTKVYALVTYQDTKTVTATGVSSSNHTLRVWADSSDFHISVDGVESDNISLAGASVYPNASNYIFMTGNSMPYADNVTLSVGGTQQLYLAPNAMLIGTNIPDRSANSHNGTITWGSNSGVAITYGEMASYESYAATVNITGGFDMPTAAMPSSWFASGENASALPFYESFSSVSVQTGKPVQVYYFWAIIGVAFGAFLGIVVLTRSALMAYIAMVIVFGIGASMTIVPAWIVFVMIIVGVGIMYLYRQVAY